MKERKGIITLYGRPMTLLGAGIQAGDPAPEFKLLNNDLSPFQAMTMDGKVSIISSVPSLDTPVCDMQTRRFNQEAAALGEDVRIFTISMDLPFAQKRWCGAAGVEAVTTLSDHVDASFGTGFGVLIKELRLLARAVFILDRRRIVQYVQIVPEISNEPDYNAVLEKAKIIGNG